MSKTLVIHPEDASTVMLEYVYQDKDFDVIRNPNISRKELETAIKNHDRIILLGHGTPDGLIHPDLMKYGFRANCKPFIIDDSFADLLRSKETISMWCFSDKYFERNHIPGFHTGMIISEVNEANYMLGHCPLTEKELFNNMVHLSKLLNECIDEKPEAMKEYILNHYVGEDDITQFNRKNIKVLY